MKTGLFASALGLTICMALSMVHVSGKNWTLISEPPQDDTWTVVEYPEGQEIVVELNSPSTSDAKGSARVLRGGNEVTIIVVVNGLNQEDSAQHVYVVDSMGNASLLGDLTLADGAGSLDAKTALSKFMLVVSPEDELTTIGTETKVALRSAIPNGFTVVAKEKSDDVATADSSPETLMEPAMAETPDYDVPLLNVGSLKRGSNTMLKATFSGGFAGTRANIEIKPQKNGPTQIKMRFIHLKEPPEGTQYVLWQAAPDNSYSLLGRLPHADKKNETRINAETLVPDFGLFITFENAEASTPAGSIVATIVR